MYELEHRTLGEETEGDTDLGPDSFCGKLSSCAMKGRKLSCKQRMMLISYFKTEEDFLF